MNKRFNYLKQIEDLPPGRMADYCTSSNFDEEYLRIFPELTKKLFLNLISRYPNYANQKTAELIRKKFRLKNIVLGAGSEDIITRVNRILVNQRSSVGIVAPFFYRISETLERYDLINWDDFLKRKFVASKFIWLCNPNPMNGKLIKREALLKLFSQNSKTFFFIDETAIFFLKDWEKYSLIKTISPKDNCLVILSLSKFFGISGLRAGFATGNQELVIRLPKEGNTFPYTSITDYFVQRILRTDEIFFEKLRDKIFENKKEIESILWSIGKIEVIPSETNCVFCRYKNKPDLYRDLIKLGIFGLDLNKSDGISQRGLVRLTIHSSKKLHENLIKRLYKLQNDNEAKN